MGTGMALSIILYTSSILAAMASCCVLVKFVSLGATYGLALGLYHLPIVFMMRSSLHGASWAYEYDAVERISKRMMICFFIIENLFIDHRLQFFNRKIFFKCFSKF